MDWRRSPTEEKTQSPIVGALLPSFGQGAGMNRAERRPSAGFDHGHHYLRVARHVEHDPIQIRTAARDPNELTWADRLHREKVPRHTLPRGHVNAATEPWTRGDDRGRLGPMLGPGSSRRHIAGVLNTAYADGLLSQETFAHRLDQVFGERLLDPVALIGDLNVRSAPRRMTLRRVAAAASGTLRRARSGPVHARAVLLALDWNGGQSEVLLGRLDDCDVVLASEAVSRKHARLFFRDGNWVIRDLGSTNGTSVNGVPIGRSRLQPGDEVVLGDTLVRID